MRKKHIFSKELIFNIAYELRKHGKTIGLTHGAFDLFHYGHLDLLNKSSEHCDFLIVGVESDESIKEYKSEYRPIIPEYQRFDIINSLATVDAVFIKDKEFLDDLVIDLYKEISPTFISFGRKYSWEEGIRDCASKAGTKTHKYRTIQPPQSTSKIIRSVITKHEEEMGRATSK